MLIVYVKYHLTGRLVRVNLAHEMATAQSLVESAGFLVSPNNKDTHEWVSERELALTRYPESDGQFEPVPIRIASVYIDDFYTMDAGIKERLVGTGFALNP